jgi:hypothetical protein
MGKMLVWYVFVLPPPLVFASAVPIELLWLILDREIG